MAPAKTRRLLPLENVSQEFSIPGQGMTSLFDSYHASLITGERCAPYYGNRTVGCSLQSIGTMASSCGDKRSRSTGFEQHEDIPVVCDRVLSGQIFPVDVVRTFV